MTEDILKGGVKAKWSKLTEEDLIATDGKVENLVELLQAKYGYSKNKAEEEYKRFISTHKKRC